MSQVTSLTSKIADLLKDTLDTRNSAISEYCKVYLQTITNLYGGAMLEEKLSNIELVEQWSEDRLTIKWYFREKNK